MVVGASDAYYGASWRFAFVFSLLLTSAFYLLVSDFDFLIYLLFEIPAVLSGLALAQIPWIKRLFLSKAEIEEEVFQRAVQAFYENQLHSTRDRTGILIFVSLLEHRVNILADAGINKKVSKNTWDDIVTQLILDIKKKRVEQGLCQAITTCGEILAKHFPIKADDTNELSNKLITE